MRYDEVIDVPSASTWDWGILIACASWAKGDVSILYDSMTLNELFLVLWYSLYNPLIYHNNMGKAKSDVIKDK